MDNVGRHYEDTAAFEDVEPIGATIRAARLERHRYARGRIRRMSLEPDLAVELLANER